MDLEILEFLVPVENNKTLFVWNIEPSRTEAQIQENLFAVFSGFGPLYLLKVCQNDPLSSSGFYAVIKFYSASQASLAQRHADGRPLFQSLPLKVRLASKQNHQTHRRPLGHAKCTDMANQFLGFNNWSSDIITLKQLTEDEDEDEEEEGGGVRRTLRFGCLMQLTFPQHGRTTRGAAVVEETVTCAGPEMILQKRCQLQKLVRHKALAEAFSSVLLVRLGGEKIMVEVKPTGQLTLDDPDRLVKVNCLDPDQDDPDLDDMEASSDFIPQTDDGQTN